MRLSSRWTNWHCSRNFYFAVASVLALMGFCFCAIADVSHVIKYAPNPSYDNIPITPNTWEEVDLIYYSTISGHRYTNTIQLLRPIAWLHKRHMGIIGSKVTLSMPEFGIVNVMATVKAIKPTQIDTRGVDWSKQNGAPVIGKFMRYVTDVRTYTFKDSLGHINHINATPNHPFYVKNKHGFVAIGNISDNDTLLGAVGFGDNHIDGAVHLVCAKGKHSHCGAYFGGDGLPTPVYNFEVYKRHVYRVGNNTILVHNGCVGSKQLLTGNYSLSGYPKEVPFNPKIFKNGEWVDDSPNKYQFYTMQDLTGNDKHILTSWSMYNQQLSEMASESAVMSELMMNGYKKDKALFSLVRYEGNLAAISRFDDNGGSWNISYTVSDPLNLVAIYNGDEGAYRGFGTELKRQGILEIRESKKLTPITSHATTMPSAAINKKLGFKFISPY